MAWVEGIPYSRAHWWWSYWWPWGCWWWWWWWIGCIDKKHGVGWRHPVLKSPLPIVIMIILLMTVRMLMMMMSILHWQKYYLFLYLHHNWHLRAGPSSQMNDINMFDKNMKIIAIKKTMILWIFALKNSCVRLNGKYLNIDKLTRGTYLIKSFSPCPMYITWIGIMSIQMNLKRLLSSPPKCIFTTIM